MQFAIFERNLPLHLYLQSQVFLFTIRYVICQLYPDPFDVFLFL